MSVAPINIVYVHCHDYGRRYGPLPGAGKICLRRMKPTTAGYRGLAVSTP